MAGFLYYFPGLMSAKTPDDLPKECELGHLSGASINTRRVENGGPDLGGGLCVTVYPETKDGKAPTCGIYKDRQEWIEVQTVVDGKEKTTHWLGWEKDNRPAPVDLVRKSPSSGWPVAIDGNDWTIPCVHVPITTLPRRFVMHATGPQLKVCDQYEEVCKLSEEWYRAAACGQFNATYKQAFDFAVLLMGINYRVGPWELSSLGILDTQTTMDIVDAGIGVPQIEAEFESKKKDGIVQTG